MKIAINECYGGFGISLDLLYELILLNHPGIKTYPCSNFCDNRSVKHNLLYRDGYTHDGLSTWLVKDGIHYIFDRDKLENRTDLIILNLIEKMGENANGPHAEIKVVEIPDEVGDNWQIEEYDGLEWISETHRTWN